MSTLNRRPLNTGPLNGPRLTNVARLLAALDDDTVEILAVATTEAAIAATLDDDIVEFVAALSAMAYIDSTLGDDAAAFTATAAIAASLVATLDDDLAQLTGSVTAVAAMAVTLDDDAPYLWAFYDWSALLGTLEVLRYYACDITVGSESRRIPISSWQGTLQLDRASYLQAVIPAAGPHIDWALSDGATFTISEGVRLESGGTQESVIATAPVQTPVISEGPTNTTLTISGYTTFDAVPGAPRELRNIRTRNNQGALRIRSDIDLFLRPGQTAVTGGIEFTVAYINYYANQTDRYMDVGERRI